MFSSFPSFLPALCRRSPFLSIGDARTLHKVLKKTKIRFYIHTLFCSDIFTLHFRAPVPLSLSEHPSPPPRHVLPDIHEHEDEDEDDERQDALEGPALFVFGAWVAVSGLPIHTHIARMPRCIPALRTAFCIFSVSSSCFTPSCTWSTAWFMFVCIHIHGQRMVDPVSSQVNQQATPKGERSVIPRRSYRQCPGLLD